MGTRSKLTSRARDLSAMANRAAQQRTAATDTAVWVPLAEIVVDPNIQVRVAGLDREKVNQYALAMGEGAEFPPVILYRDKDKLWLADGFHRREAAIKAGWDKINAEVRPGDRVLAQEFAEEANLAHGLALTLEDKKNIFIRRLQRGHSWTQLSNRAIAAQLGVSEKTIRRLKSEMTAALAAVEPTDKRIGADGRTYDVTRIKEAAKAKKTERYVKDEFSQDQNDDEPYLNYDDEQPAVTHASSVLNPVRVEMERRRVERQADPPPPGRPRGGVIPPSAQPTGVGPALLQAVALQTAILDTVRSLERLTTFSADQRLVALPAARKVELRDGAMKLGAMLAPAHDHLAAIYELLGGEYEDEEEETANE